MTTIILDINTLPEAYKTKNLKAGIKRYEKDFNVKIIPLDTSRQNLQGAGHFVTIVPTNTMNEELKELIKSAGLIPLKD